MSSLKDRLKKTSLKAKDLTESSIYAPVDSAQTGIYALNIALGGSLTSGVSTGIITLGAPSRHFKSGFALSMVAAYLNKHPEAICLFYDSERGISKDFFRSQGVDPDRVLVSEIKNYEELKFDLMNQLTNNITKDDKVIILVDSLGGLASKKEIEDAIDEKSVADMTRAKASKSLFRMITPYINEYEIPMVAIQHVYSEIGMFPKTILSGGTGGMLASSVVLFIGKSKVADGKDLLGHTFTITAEKSRYVKEKSKIPITVKFDEDINPYTGLIDIALSTGDIVKPNNARYAPVLRDAETGEVVPSDKTYFKKDIIENAEFWEEIMFKQTDFPKNVEKMYKL